MIRSFIFAAIAVSLATALPLYRRQSLVDEILASEVRLLLHECPLRIQPTKTSENSLRG
jgi:hypothetical protein